MKQKIEWYKEVLELEPGSRVFFPLAKLLAADGQSEEAIATLQQGLLRHPEHLEARLLLVELLFNQEDDAKLMKEIAGLGGLFASYPGFWKAWSKYLSATPGLNDAALAMRFFAAALQGRQISWSSVIEQGLRTLLLGEEHACVEQAPEEEEEEPEPVDASPDVTEHPESATAESSEPDAAPLPEAAPMDASPIEAAPVLEEASSAVQERQQAFSLLSVEPEAEANEEEEVEEAFSLRTRSMADVLAEQGDVAGALDIYQELLQAAPDEDKLSLQARMDELSSRTTVQGAAEETKTEEKIPAQSGESTRLVTLLESLAQRLEARAR